MKEKNGYVQEILISLIAVIVTFFLYIDNYFKYNNDLVRRIEALLENNYISNSKIVIVIIMSVSLLLLIIIGFIIYKIIFKVCKCKIEEKKLLISVLTGEAFSFLIGYFIMGIIPMLLVTIICNVAEAFMVFLMNSKDIKGKLLKPVIVRGVLIIVNVLATIIIK